MSIFRSIKTRLLVFGLSISLIPIFIITSINYFNARSILKEQIINDFLAIAESKRQHLLTFVDAKKSRTIDFSSDGFIRDSLDTITQIGRQSYAVADLNRHLKVNKKPLDHQIETIAIVDRDGIVVSSNNEASIGKDISSRNIFVKSISSNYGEAYVGQTYKCLYLKDNCIVISAPLTHKSDGETMGVIINYYDLGTVSEFTTGSIGMGESGEVYVVNRDKLMLTESRFLEGAILNQAVDTVPVRRIIDGDNTGMTDVYPNYRGVPVIGVSVDMPELGWILMVEMDKTEAFAPLLGLGIIALIVGGISGVAVIFAGIFFSISTARPINRLKYAAERIAGGDLKHRVDIDRGDEIGSLAVSFNNMTNKLDQLTGSLEQRVDKRTKELRDVNRQLQKLSRAVEQSPSTIVITDIEGNIEYVNPKFTQLTGYSAKEVIGQNPRILKTGKTTPQEYKCLWNTIKSGREWYGEFCNKKKDGELYWEVASISSIRNSEGVITHFVAVKEDITERKNMEEKLRLFNKHLEQKVNERTDELSRRNKELRAQITERRKAEEQIETSLKEKETLLREVHHRVKNNLQIISSLLDMSSMQAQNQETIDLFSDSRNRVNAMALIHTQLYRSERFDRINMHEHILELSKSLLQIYSIEKVIALDIESANIFLNINQAIPCALVLNELITNVCKHAYREGQKGTIRIAMQKPGGDTILLRVKDDGVGIPEGFDIDEVKSLGLSLVRNLIYNQLKGKIDFRRNKGTEILIEFKASGGG